MTTERRVRTNQTIFDVLTASAKLFRNHEAIFDGSQRCSYRELWLNAKQLAAGLSQRGVGRGDKVIVCLPNWNEFVIVYFALAKLGAILIPGNPSYQNKEWEKIASIKGVKAVFCAEIDEYREQLLQKSLTGNLGNIITVRFAKQGLLKFADVLERGRTTADNPLGNLVEPEDVFASLYTSGSTGDAKNVMLTHENFIYSAGNAVKAMACSEADKFLVPLPLSHVFGLVPGVLGAVMVGGKIVLMQKFRAEQAINLIAQEKITVHLGVPTMFILELNHPLATKEAFSSLRTGIVGGAPCAVEIVKKMSSHLGCNIIVSYGMTETAGGITYTALDDEDQVRSETVGRSLEGTEIKIVDEERFEVPKGGIGELACRGRGVMKGYFFTATASIGGLDSKGWFYTGDLARMDEHGYVTLVGRKKDLIIRGGYNIYPQEIEEILFNHPHVIAASVVGIADCVVGETVCAAIKLAPGKHATAASVKEFLSSKVAHYKVPERIIFVDNFPLSQTGKIDKKTLRELCEKEKEMQFSII